MRFHQKAALGGQQPLFMPESRWTPPAELPSLRGEARIAVDIETYDPDLRDKGPGFRRGARIVGLGVGTEAWRTYLPVGHEGGGNLPESIIRAWAREELGAFGGEVVGANLGYDLDGLSTCWGVDFPAQTVFHDVQVAEPLLDEWRDAYNLDALAQDYLGEGKDETLLREAAAAFGFSGRDEIKRNLHRYPANLVGPYVESDLDRPLRIFRLQEVRLREEGLWDLYDGVERRLIPILVRMRQRGIRIAQDKIAPLRQAFVLRRDAQVTRVKDLVGPSAELMEPQSLVGALEARGMAVLRTPKSNAPRIDKVFLEKNAGDPLVDAIREGRKFNTMINTFIDGQILGHLTNGRVHPTFKQSKDDDGGTIARLSGQHPNAQFIPARDAELAPLVRGLFLPEDGEEWQRDDQSQVQYRLLVNFAVGRGAEEARQRYNNDPTMNYHLFVGEMLGVAKTDKIKYGRVKNTNFAKGFGAQVPKLAATFGCSLEEAAAFVAEYEEKLPFSVETFNAAARWGQKRGYVTTVLNRKQRFPFWGPQRYQRRGPPVPLFHSREEAVEYWLRGDPKKYRGWQVRSVERINTYMALNRKLQGSEGDITKKWMVDADAAGLFNVLGPLLVTVHDELGSSIPRTSAGDEAGKELAHIGETVVKLRVPLMVDSKRAADWGACK
jgi:DNA polymerase I-like protein with 3'-5' exonuclease and polymerase domains